MDVSRQGVLPKAEVQADASGYGKPADAESRASLAGKTVRIHAPNIAGLIVSGGAFESGLVDSTAGPRSVKSKGAEVSISNMPETEVAGAGSTVAKVPEPLVLKEYQSNTHALKSLTGLTLREELGEGTWGRVKKAWDPDVKDLAVKINSASDKNHPYLQANPNKYDVAALLLPGHPYIMKNHSVLVGSKQHTDSYGIITHPDQLPPEAMKSLYIAAVVSEFANGKSLGEIIKKYTVEREHLIVIARQLAGALAHMHKHGFAHRDVSAHNVLYHPEHGLKLIDMGSVIKTTGRAVSYVGTTQLLAIDGFDPSGGNKCIGFDYDTKALDSWELGCVLFYCLTGQHVNLYQPSVDGFKFTDNQQLSSGRVTEFAHKTDSQKEAIIRKYLKSGLWQSGIDSEFLNIVTGLLKGNPAERLSVEEAKKQLDNLPDNRETVSTVV